MHWNMAMRHPVRVVDLTRRKAQQQISDRRELLNLTQMGLAKRADVSLSSVGRLERGSRVARKVEIRIARALGWTDDSIESIFSRGEPVVIEKTFTQNDDVSSSTRAEIGSMPAGKLIATANLISEASGAETAFLWLKNALELQEEIKKQSESPLEDAG